MDIPLKSKPKVSLVNIQSKGDKFRSVDTEGSRKVQFHTRVDNEKPSDEVKDKDDDGYEVQQKRLNTDYDKNQGINGKELDLVKEKRVGNRSQGPWGFQLRDDSDEETDSDITKDEDVNGFNYKKAGTTPPEEQKSKNLDEGEYKLTRTYSDSEVNNFDEETGHRLYDDDFFRPKRAQFANDDENPPGVSKIYSRSHGQPYGIEDEYIPGLNFSEMVYKWSDTPDLSRTNSTASFLDLDDLHAKVSPKKIMPAQNNHGPVNNHPFADRFTNSAQTSFSTKELPPIKRLKSSQSDFDAILQSLPENFNDLPYSQRKKIVKSINDNIDYSQFSVYMKNYFGKKTLAGRLLSSTHDLKKSVPVNIDERGARVMEFELGKVIGFGAWGTIRECFNCENKSEIYAMKIVNNKGNNILSIFKKEISIWETLNHKNILTLIKYLETENAIFCLMNRINGGTLFDLVLKWGVYDIKKPNKTRIDLTLNYVKQITDGIDYLHKLGIVHGDIKLENILIRKFNERGENKLPNGDSSVECYPERWQMIICDFGMSRYYKQINRSTLQIRSKSSMTGARKPYFGESVRSKLLLNELENSLFENQNKSLDILSTGIEKNKNSEVLSGFEHPDLRARFQPRSKSRSSSPIRNEYFTNPSKSHSIESIKQYMVELKNKDLKRQSQVDLNLPDSHIGSLPYASPELLLPNPPPLGPSADIWAFGILIYTMIIGKLPFQHFYEPRLRAMIIKGKYKQQELLAVLQDYQWFKDLIYGCLETDITKRLDIDLINDIMSTSYETE